MPGTHFEQTINKSSYCDPISALKNLAMGTDISIVSYPARAVPTMNRG